MNLAAVLRDSWRITWTNPALWALALFMFLAFVPAGALSFSFSTVASTITLPTNDPQLRGIIGQMQDVPSVAWVGIALVALLLLVVTTSATLTLQAASMRGAALAAEHGKVSLGEALRLGRARAINIVKLSAAFGVIAAVIGIGPSLALILLGDKSPPGVSLIHLAQTGLSPVTMALNFVVLLAIMSVALEDFTPRAAFGRAGSVLRSGWWAFLIVIGLTAAAVIVSAILLVVPPVIIAPTILLDPRTGILLTLGSCACTGLLAGFFLLFTAVFTQTLYTLVYRAAARLTQPK